MRKTDKFFRETLAKGVNNDTFGLICGIIAVVKKHGYKSGDSYCIAFDRETRSKNFNWNHTISGFRVSSKDQLIVNIYWQGDSTDGTEQEYLTDIIRGKTIPAEYDNVGGRWGVVCRHSSLNITRDEVDKAIKALAEWISPKAIKERKLARERADRKINVERKARELCIDNKNDYSYGWHADERYWNGKRAVDRLVENEFEKLFPMTDEELTKIFNKVFDNNYKKNYDLNGKEYNLAY